MKKQNREINEQTPRGLGSSDNGGRGKGGINAKMRREATRARTSIIPLSIQPLIMHQPITHQLYEHTTKHPSRIKTYNQSILHQPTIRPICQPITRPFIVYRLYNHTNIIHQPTILLIAYHEHLAIMQPIVHNSPTDYPRINQPTIYQPSTNQPSINQSLTNQPCNQSSTTHHPCN